MATSYDRERPRSEATLRVEALLGRYPKLSEQELAELIDLFPRLGLLDQALMSSDDRLAGKLRDFHRNYRKEMKAETGGLLILFAFPTLIAIGLLWWAIT